MKLFSKSGGIIVMALLALFLVWDRPVDIDGNPVAPEAITEYNVYVDGELKATVPTERVPMTGLGWGNKKLVTVEAVASTGEVSPLSDPLERVQLRNGGDNQRVIKE